MFLGSLKPMGTCFQNENSRADPCQSFLFSSRGPFEMNISDNRPHSITLSAHGKFDFDLNTGDPPLRYIQLSDKEEDKTNDQTKWSNFERMQRLQARRGKEWQGTNDYIRQDKYRTDQLLI